MDTRVPEVSEALLLKRIEELEQQVRVFGEGFVPRRQYAQMQIEHARQLRELHEQNAEMRHQLAVRSSEASLGDKEQESGG